MNNYIVLDLFLFFLNPHKQHGNTKENENDPVSAVQTHHRWKLGDDDSIAGALLLSIQLPSKSSLG